MAFEKVRAHFSGQTIKAVAMRGAVWSMSSFAATSGIRLASTLILTRLLAPEIFGLMSLATVFVSGLQMLSDVGTVPSIIRSERGDEPSFLRTAWTIQVIRGLFLCVGLIAIAWPVSKMYDEPQLFPLFVALSLNPVIQGFSSIAAASCQRHTQLKWLSIQGVAVQLLTTALNILAAWWFQSVWALVVGSIGGTLFRCFLSYRYLPQRVRVGFEWDKTALDEIVRFGRWVLLGTFFTYLSGQGSVAIMGAMVPIDVIGLFTLATTYSGAVNQLVMKLVNQIAFPAMSRMNREGPEGLPRAVGKIKQLICFFVLPTYVTLSFMARPLIGFLYDPRYAEAGAFLSFTALNMAIGSLSMPYQNAMLASGDSRSHALVTGIRVILRTTAMVIGFWLGGMYGILVGFGIVSFLTYLMAVSFARRAGRAHVKYDLITLAVVSVAYAYNWSVVAYG